MIIQIATFLNKLSGIICSDAFIQNGWAVDYVNVCVYSYTEYNKFLFTFHQGFTCIAWLILLLIILAIVIITITIIREWKIFESDISVTSVHVRMSRNTGKCLPLRRIPRDPFCIVCHEGDFPIYTENQNSE